MYRPRKRTVSAEQIGILVEFMEKHPDIARGKCRTIEARTRSARLWMHVTKKLNDIGLKRTPKEWQKHYTDYKCRLLNRAEKIQLGEGETTALTPLEQRLVNIIGTNRPKKRTRSNSNEPLQSLLEDSSAQFDHDDEEGMDTKPHIDARSLSPPSDPDWPEDVPDRRRDPPRSSTNAETEERATRAIENQATSMERMATALERIADAVSSAIDRYINNNNHGQFV